MARRRSMMQGMGVPEAGTVGPGPTMWQEPKGVPTSPMAFNPANTGAQRNYGSTPGYVDTVPHRWTVGQPTITAVGLGRIAKTRTAKRAADASARESARWGDIRRTTEDAYTGGSPYELAYEKGLKGRPDITTTPTGEGFPPSEGMSGDIPSSPGFRGPKPTEVRSGRPVPRPPSEAEDVSGSTPPVDKPWMEKAPEGGAESAFGDPFMKALRDAPSDTSSSDEGRWKDDRDMPVLGLPGRAGEKAIETNLRSGSKFPTTPDTDLDAQWEAARRQRNLPITAPSDSRAQNRKKST